MAAELLTVSGAARHLNVSESYLNKLRWAGGSPPFMRLGRSVRYSVEDLDAWAADRKARSTSDQAQPHG